MGNIGKRVGRIAEAFGAEIAYFDPFAKNVPEHYKSMGIDELMSVADVVSIHSPLTPETENLINYERMCKMKPGAYIVNVARGKIVNEPDLCRALNEKRLFAAALDVFEQEPVSADNVLLTQLQEPHRFLASPHIAWSSEEARAKLIDIMTGHIKDYFKV